MKRRKLISLGLGGGTLAVGYSYLSRTAKVPTTLSNNQTEIPPVLSNRLFQFIAVGDVGTGEKGQYAVARAMDQYWRVSSFSLSLLTGDNIYPDGEIEKIRQVFEQPYSALLANGVKFYASLGNHDVRTNQGQDEIVYPGYNMAARYYSFTKQSVQFFALDTNQANFNNDQEEMLWRDQLAWLQTELTNSSAKWKVVFGHHPVYSSGHHGSHPQLIEDLAPIFTQQGVQIYINGHDHNYERTQPFNGTTYITSGNGALRRRVEKSSWTALISNQLGFTVFDVHPDRIIVKAINTRNTIYDEAHILSSS